MRTPGSSKSENFGFSALLMHSSIQLFSTLIYLGADLTVSTAVALGFHHDDASEQEQEKTLLLPPFSNLENPPTSGVPAVNIHP